MEIVYLLVSLFVFYKFFLTKRHFDFLTIGFVSQQLYFSPCLAQIFINSDSIYLYEVHWGVYLSGTILVLLFFIFSIGINYKQRDIKSLGLGFEYHALYATILGLLSFVISYIQVGTVLFNAEKSQVLNSIDRFYIVWSISSLYGLSASFLNNKKILLYINIILILLTVYIGFRSIAAVGVICILVLSFVSNGDKVNLIVSHYKKIIIGFFAGIFFLVYKGLYIAIKFQNYDLVFLRLLDKDFYLSVIINAEPFGIQKIFSDVLQQKYFIGLDNFDRFFLLFTLFGDQFGVDTRSFNEYFQPDLYGDVGYGVGSNVWAHMYSSGGWLLLLIFSIIYVLSLRWLSKSIYSVNKYYLPLLICLGSYWSFYIHRNDLFYQLGLERRVLIIFLLVSILSLATNRIRKIRR